MTRRLRTFTLLVAGGTLVSCGGGDSNPTGPDDDGGGGGGGGGPQMTRLIKPNPSFEQDIQDIFVRTRCADAGCHAAGQGGFFLRPNDAANYTNIVNVDSETEREFPLIKPFDATNSYIVIRVEGRQRVGVTMPIGAQLDSIDLTNLKNWINNGAPDN